jgi:phosphoglycerate dehydrogenase-like enzyme
MTALRIVGLLVTALVTTWPGAGFTQETPRGELQLGSTQNSIPAIPAAELPDTLLYLSSGMSEDLLAAIRAVAPNVEVIGGLDRESVMRYAENAHGVDAHLLTSEFLASSPRLRWALSWSAGVERYIAIPELMSRQEVVLTNMKGMYGPVIAEHVFAMMLTLTRDLPYYIDADRRGEWSRGPGSTLSALQDRTMLVVGLGGIGSEIGRRAHAFNMRVLGTVRTARPAPPYVEELGTAADLDRFLPMADIVVLAVPLTEETRGMIDRKAIDRMKDGAWLVNIARGAVVDTDALLEALDSGKIGAALLDVTDPEPLPADHPLWDRDNVFITPHIAARAELSVDRRFALIVENMSRFGAGEPLLNVVDREAGY